MIDHLWHYRARVERVVDGDTLDVTIDVGYHAYHLERLRLLNCWAPETRGPERVRGLAAKAWVEAWVLATQEPLDAWPLIIRTEKSDAFGRYLADVWSARTSESMNEAMVLAGHATKAKMP